MGSKAARVGSEAARLGGGAARVGSEAARVGSEAARVGSEAARVGGGAARVGSETARMGSEAARVGGEAARVDDEEEHIGGEEARVDGRAARVSGGAARVGGEAARVGGRAMCVDGRAARTASRRRARIDVARWADHHLAVNDRLRQFRLYMASLDAAVDPRVAIERGLYVPQAGRSLSDEVAGRLELQPASTHLVVGGIGSGKSTQLLVATKRLSALTDTVAEYVDVSMAHDITALEPRVLLVLAGLRLTDMLDEPSRAELAGFVQEIQDVAQGYATFRRPSNISAILGGENSLPVPVKVRVPGVLKPPPSQVPPATPARFIYALSHLRERVAQRVPHLVFLFDSLDRLTGTQGFEQVVMEDVKVLRSLEIGVVLVGPLKLLYGAYRPITQRFDAIHQVQWNDPDNSSGREFLLQVVKARAPKGLLSDEAAIRLGELSGGVLRDLIGLARNAGEEAYLSGEAQITAAHCEAAGEAFGRTLLLGLGSDDLAKLQAVRTQGSFVPVSDKDLALLMTGRVLEYRGRRTRYAVHPTIRPLLEQLAEQP